MLRTFRKGADGFLAKLLLGFLVMTFALWGIGDIFRGAPDNIIANVNEKPITMGELESLIRAEQSRYPELTAEVAQSLPLRLQMLNRMINTRLLEAEAKAMGIDFSEDAVSERIANDPIFQNEDGLFSREIFLNLLRQNNISQGAYLQRFKSDLRTQLLNGIIANAVTASDAMAELYYHIENEQREASLLLLDMDDIKHIEQPGNEAIATYYERVRESFRRPEYRTYRYVYFDAGVIAEQDGVSPTEEEIRNYYNAQYGDNGNTEVPSYEESKDAISELLSEEALNDRLTELSNQLDDSVAGGATLEEALGAAELSSLKIETLGPISATNNLKNGETYLMKPYEQEILSSAFEQDAGEISPISISSDGRYYLVETLEVIPTEIPELSDVEQEVRQRLLEQQKQQRLQTMAKTLSEELQAAENPKVLIDEQGYTLQSTGKIKRYHDTVSNNSKLKDKILPSDLVQALFALKDNEVTSPYPLPSGEMAIGLLDDVHPAKDPGPEDIEASKLSLNEQLRLQALGAYLNALRDHYQVEIFMDKIAVGSANNG